MAQTPPTHRAVAWLTTQTLPHPPQLAASVFVSVSQGVARSPSHSRVASGHVDATQWLWTHARVLAGPHFAPHVPQLARLVSRFVSQSTPASLQWANGGEHTLSAHVPSVHPDAPCAVA